MVFPDVADAADAAPPIIQHVPLSDVAPGQVIARFTVSDSSELFGVLFHWRFIGETNYRTVKLDRRQTDFAVSLNARRSFEFWIEAYDEFGNGPALDGSAEKPNLVRVNAPPVQPAAPIMSDVPSASPRTLVRPVIAVSVDLSKAKYLRRRLESEAGSAPTRTAFCSKGSPCLSPEQLLERNSAILLNRFIPLFQFEASSSSNAPFRLELSFLQESSSSTRLQLKIGQHRTDPTLSVWTSYMPDESISLPDGNGAPKWLETLLAGYLHSSKSRFLFSDVPIPLKAPSRYDAGQVSVVTGLPYSALNLNPPAVAGGIATPNAIFETRLTSQNSWLERVLFAACWPKQVAGPILTQIKMSESEFLWEDGQISCSLVQAIVPKYRQWSEDVLLVQYLGER